MKSDTRLLVFEEHTRLFETAAGDLLAVAQEAVDNHGRFLWAVSGGSTPQPLFRHLAKAPYREAFPWTATHLLWTDERAVPPDDEASNYGLVQRLLLRRVPVPVDQIHRMRGESGAATAAAAYVDALRRLAPAGMKWPRLDVALLGLGSDGHTASLFPGAPETSSAALPAAPVHATYEKRPAERITLTPPVLNSSRHVWFLVTGAAKAAALAATLAGPRDPVRWPAQRIEPEDGQLVWYVDADAASQLDNNQIARERI